MVQIIFETHGSTFDNEQGLASGTFDVELSPLGEKQAGEMRSRYENSLPNIVFCSDLKRAIKTAEIAFGGNKIQIIRDPRLRECNIGDMTRKPVEEEGKVLLDHVKTPFSEGESFEQITERVKEFLNSIFTLYDGKTVVVIGHRATQYGLEHLLKGVPLEQAIITSWKWEPGWKYQMREKL